MLTGQYFQIGLIMYFLIVTPFTVSWIFAVENLLIFFGFDDETVRYTLLDGIVSQLFISSLTHTLLLTRCVNCALSKKVETGYQFTKVYVFYMIVRGLDEYMNAFLDISDHEQYSTITTSCRELSVALVLLVLPLLARDPPTLQEGGFCMLVVAILYLIWNVVFVACQGWWKKYYSGMVYSFALNVRI
jgi:hypothetical protein